MRMKAGLIRLVCYSVYFINVWRKLKAQLHGLWLKSLVCVQELLVKRSRGGFFPTARTSGNC